MALPSGLNDLAKLTLLVSDASYFTSKHPVLSGSALAALHDTTYGTTPQYSIPSGFFEVARGVDSNTGFGFIAYRKVGSTPADTEIIIAMRGTDGPNPQDWVSNSQYLGWNQWNTRGAGRDLIFNFLDSLKPDADTAFQGKIHFTGQSLGGGLAQYAAYEYVQSHQGLTGFNKANITLTTFNGFGGVLGLQQNTGAYNPNVLANIGSNAHFYTEGDLVSRLGSLNGVGHTGGTAYMLNAHATEINPDTGEPYLLNAIEAHRIETGFYPFLLPGVEFEAAEARLIDYLPIQNVQQMAAMFGRAFNDQDISPLESAPRLAAGLITAISLGNRDEINALAQAVLINLHAANEIDDEWYVTLRKYDWGALAGSTAFKVPAAAGYGVALLGAMLSDALEFQVDRHAQLFNNLREWVSNGVPTVSQGISSEDRCVQVEMMLALVPGAAIGSKLASILQPLNLDINQFTQTLTTTGESWMREALDMIRERANALGHNLGTLSATLTSAIADIAVAIGASPAIVQGYVDRVLLPFVRDTAQGIGNAVTELVQNVAGAFDLGRVLNLADIQLIDQAYAAELSDSRISSSVRSAIEEAREIVQHAGQTVVIHTGVGANPFDTPGYVPGGASSATVEERLGEVFRLSLPFAAGAGGQRISLRLQGLQANQLSVATDDGAQTIGPDGTVELIVPEGADQVLFTLIASDEVSADATVTLAATLVDEMGEATHTTQIESTISVKAFVGNTEDGYEIWVEDYSDDMDSGLGYAMGVGGFYHQTLRGSAGNDHLNILHGFGDDTLYGNGGNDRIAGSYGNDSLYGGTGNDRLLADRYDYHTEPIPRPGLYSQPPTLDGNDYADGGEGDDLIGGGGNEDRLIGGAGDDEIWGDALTEGIIVDNPDGSQTEVFMTGVLVPGDDVLEGGAGNDRLSGDGGDDMLDGGDGDDLLVGDTDPTIQLIHSMAPGDDYLAGGAGNDELQGKAGDDVLLGGVGNDRLFGDDDGVTPSMEGNDWLEGNDGIDTLVGYGGDDSLIGGTGADVLLAGTGDDTLVGEDGDDIGIGGEGEDEIVGGTGDDQLDGEAGDDVIIGDEGEDLLIGGDGSDTLDGCSGDDRMSGDAGNDMLFGGDGDDEVQGNNGSDLLVGDAGSDTMFGQADDDNLFGDDGNDSMWGGLGKDLLEGGVGDDVLAGDDTDLAGGVGGDDILAGGQGNDYLGGGGGRDTYLFNPGDGYDVIRDFAFEGNRILFGEGISSTSIIATVGPNDSLVIRAGGGDVVEILQFGMDNLTGFHPIDTFEFSDGTILTYGQLAVAAGGLGISGGFGNDQLMGTAQGERMYGGIGNDTIEGAQGADTLIGEDGTDILLGGADNDQLLGGTGDDVMRGGEGDDVLQGEAGTDSLEGEAGDDLLAGGIGDDQLYGGAGSDTYRFNLGEGTDLIFDSGPSTDLDTLVFGSGIISADLSLKADGSQILLRVSAGSEGIYLGSLFDVFGSQTIEHFQVADGTVMSYADLIARGFDIDGTVFDDVLFGSNIADRFRGGAGNDRLEGGGGHDSYFFNLGDGADTIVDMASAGAGNEVVLGVGIASNDLRLDLAPDQSDPNLSDLLLRIGTNGEAIQLDTFERDNVLGSRTVESVRFAGGSRLTYEQLLARGFDLSGTDGDDQIAGTNVADRILAGNGADVIRGGLGDDRLDGGLDNDQLLGGQGSDTYVFGVESGQDIVTEFQGNQDRILMAPGVAPSDVVVTRQNNDLVFSLNGEADRLTVVSYFEVPPMQIELVQFADGTVWDQAFIDNLIRPAIAGTEGPDALIGTSGDDRLAGLAGDDQLTGLAGDDRLDGGSGADQLAGGMGNDTYVIDSSGDLVIEALNEGTDTVQSSVTAILAANVEHLTLTGNAPINGTGNVLDNILIGNSGVNRLSGGAGHDTYVMGAGDTVVELLGEGVDTVQTSLGATLGANVENLMLTGSAFLTGTGNALDNVLQADGSISTLAGSDGDDTYVIGPNDDDDILIETATGGIDTVIAAHAYRLPDHIENLTLLDPQMPDFASFLLIPYGSSEHQVAGYGNELNNTLVGGRANNVLDGGLGADTLIGGAGNDAYVVDNAGDIVTEQLDEGVDSVQSTVSYSLGSNAENLALLGAASINGTGNTLSNELRGNEASNVLDGGAGDDSLMGFGGADTYLYGRGSGRDMVIDSGTVGELDTIQFDATVTADAVEVYRNGYNLELAIRDTTDELTLLSFFASPGYDQKQVRFADGMVWNSAELSARAIIGAISTGTFESDTISGSDGHDLLIGSAGNDVVMGGRGKDSLYGDLTYQPFFGNQIIGDDRLEGGSGDDMLIDFRGANLFDGGAGDDALILGTGIDTVLFGPGSGFDYVTFDNNRDDIDILDMAAGIAPTDVVLTWRSASGADLQIRDSGDRMTLELSTDWFAVGPETTQAIVRFADGTQWSLAWSFSNVGMPTATSSDDVLDASSPTTLAGLDGDDTYVFGSSGVPGNYAVIEAPGEGIDTVQSLLNYVLDSQVENLILTESDSSVSPNAERGIGNELDNLIIGNTGDNILNGGEGNDILAGGIALELEGLPYARGTGSDILIGGAGDDVLMEDVGNYSSIGGAPFLNNTLDRRESLPRAADDLFIGGTGNDTYILHSQQQTVVELENEGTDTVRSTVDYVLGDQVENLTLLENPLIWLSGSLVGTGNALDNLLIGNSEDNVLSGGGGSDTLWGGRGLHRDTEIIRSGDDTLRGGSGHDTYLFNLGDGIDTIEDLAAVGEGNRIQFGTGISRNDLTATYDEVARTLTIQVGTSGTDRLVLTNFDPAGTNGSMVVEALAFADGSLVNPAALLGGPVNQAPTVAMPLADQFVPEGAPVSVTIPANTFADPDAGDNVVYRASLADGTALPAWLTFNPTTRTFTGTPDDAQVGSLDLRVTATDTGNLSVSDIFTLTITNVNDAPTVAVPLSNQTAVEDAAFTFVVPGSTFADMDQMHGDTLSYRASLAGGAPLSPWLSFDPLTRTFSGTPGNGDVGSLVLTVTATDSGNLNASTNVTLSAQNVNDAPTVAAPIADQTANEDTPVAFTIPVGTFTDADAIHGDSLSYSVTLADGSPLPTWLTFDPITRSFSGTPVPGAVGLLQLAVTATDTQAAAVSDQFTLTVSGPLPQTVVGTAGNDVLTGGRGNDTLTGGAGNDILAGGTGSDTYLFNLGDGMDTITDTSLAGEGNTVQFGAGITSNDLSLGIGSLLIRVGTNGDALHLTPFDPNNAVGARAIETFRFADGTALSYDQLIARGFDLTGTSGNDTITGTNVADRILGLAGNDTIHAGAGDDVLNGGIGADTMVGGVGNDTYVVDVFGDVVTEAVNEGIDTVESALLTYALGDHVENLVLTGTAPSIGVGNAVHNGLIGNSGANLLDGKAGADTMAGGAGDDLYMVDHTGDLVTEQANAGTDSVLAAVGYRLSANVENLSLTGSAVINGTGNDRDNVLTGNSAANVLTGLAGNDTYVIGAGDTVVESANEGIDTVVSGLTHSLAANVENLTLIGISAINGTGNGLDNVLNGLLNLAGNVLTGGSGNDTYIVGAGDTVVEASGAGIDLVQTSLTHTLGTNVENLTLLGAGAISGTGNGLGNVLTGNSAANTLNGNDGDDTLTGGHGSDQLVGGTGNDTFVFGRGAGQDLVQDHSGSGDKILYESTINPLDLVVSRQANDLRLSIHGSTDYVTVQNWHASSSNRIETIQAGNGQILASTQVDQLIQAMATFSQQTGLTWDQAIDQRLQDVQAVLAANWQ